MRKKRVKIPKSSKNVDFSETKNFKAIKIISWGPKL